jgi:hypothetical protein
MKKTKKITIGDTVNWEASEQSFTGIVRQITVSEDNAKETYTIELLEQVEENVFRSTNAIREVEGVELLSVDIQLAKTLASEFTLYKKGLGEMPVRYKQGLVLPEEVEERMMYKVILTEELADRDGETVLVKGMKVPENGVPFIDGHNMNGSVVENRLGTVKNIRIEQNRIVGDIVLVNTIKGREVKAILDDTEHPFAVSMGFGVMDYDVDTRYIKEWELFELSAVNVPANVKARVIKQLSEKEKTPDLKLEKKLKHYETIKPSHREFVKMFLSDSFVEKIGYQKTGNLLIDIAGVYEVGLDKLTQTVETPQLQKTSNKPITYTLSPKQTALLIDQIVYKVL